MGDCCGCCPFSRRNNPRKVVLLLVGLDNAGKTTAAKGLAGEYVPEAIPTVGFSSISLKHRGYSVIIYDLGGGPQIRALWRSYFCDQELIVKLKKEWIEIGKVATQSRLKRCLEGVRLQYQVHGVIFVVDASDLSRIEECKCELENLLRNEKLAGKPVLVLANKQDMPGAMDEIDIVEGLKLEQLVNEQKCLTLVEVCSAKPPSAHRKKIDQRLLKGYRWLLDQIIRDYHSLNLRVEYDAKEESVRIEQQRRLWRQRMLESYNENGIIPDSSLPNGDLSSNNHVAEWAYKNGIDKCSERPTTAESMTRVIKEQLEMKSGKQRKKINMMKNKVQPLNDYDQPPIVLFQSQTEERSLAFQALTSPRGPRPKELPPLHRPSRPSTSRSLGNEATAWDLHKELEIVDTSSLNYDSDKPRKAFEG